MKNNIEKRYLNASIANIELRSKDAGKGSRIEGYAAVFYDGTEKTEYKLWGKVVERIDKNAFDNVLERDDVRALFNHDPNMLLGRNTAGTLTLTTDDTGLKYDIALPETQVGRDVKTSVERGDLSGSSFSFVPTKVEWTKDGDKEIRVIKDVTLKDVGPVTFPAYEGSSAYARDTSGAEDEHAKLEAERKAAADIEKAKKQAQADADYADAVTALKK